MGVLLLAPHWAESSELWLRRMIRMLEPHLVAVGTTDLTPPHWARHITALTLHDHPAPAWRRAARKLRLPIRPTAAKSVDRIVHTAVSDPRVTAVLVHFLDFALRFEHVWRHTDKPLHVHCHGYDTQWDLRDHDTPEQPHFSPDYPARVRRLAARAMLIANSRCTAQRLASIGVPPERVTVKYFGVPDEPERPTDHCSTTTGAPQSETLELLYLGRLVDCKGPDLTIRAFKLACNRGLDARLTLAGDGPLRTTCELLRRHSPHAKRIRLLGPVDEETGLRLRTRADIFTAHNCVGPLTRQEEAFGVSIIEAMAASLPVVTGRSGGVCESVVHGETGILFDPGDVDAHADALTHLARDSDLRQRMGRAAQARVRAHFTCEQEHAALLRILGLAATDQPTALRRPNPCAPGPQESPRIVPDDTPAPSPPALRHAPGVTR